MNDHPLAQLSRDEAGVLPAKADVILVLANRSAGRRARGTLLERSIWLLGRRGFHVELCWEIAQLLEKTAEQVRRGRLRAVVAAGGDGTASLVTNLTPEGTPIMVLPLGTENLLARYLGIRPSAHLIANTLARGIAVRLDAGRAQDRLFLLMAGFGFDAEVVRRLNEMRRGNIDYLSYAKPMLAALRSYQYPPLRVTCSAARVVECASGDADPGTGTVEELTVTARWAFIVNLPRYALGLGIAPSAVGTDGLLDVCTFRHGWLWHGLRYLGGVMLRWHESWEDCMMLRSARVRVESDERVPYQLDGDAAGYLPVEIEAVPQRVTLVVPSRWAHQNGFRLVRQAK